MTPSPNAASTAPFVDQPGLREIYTCGWPHTVWMMVAAGAYILLAITILVLIFKPTRQAKMVLLAFWTLAPPIWFCYEYFSLFKPFGPAGTFELFKYGQEVAAKFWAGIVTLLAGSLLKPEGPATAQPTAPPTEPPA